VPDILTDQVATVGLGQMSAGEHAQCAQQLTSEPGDGGLAGAGIAGEDQVAADGRRPQPKLLALADQLREADQRCHVFLDALQADKPVQFGQQILQGFPAAGRPSGHERRRERRPARPDVTAQLSAGGGDVVTRSAAQSANTGSAPSSSSTSWLVARNLQRRMTGSAPSPAQRAG